MPNKKHAPLSPTNTENQDTIIPIPAKKISFAKTKVFKNSTYHTFAADQKYLEVCSFWPTPCFKRGTFGRSWFSAERTLISASVVPQHGWVWAQSTLNRQNANLCSSNFLSTADNKNMTKWLSHKDRRRICTCLLVSVLGTLALLIPRFSSWWPPGWAETGASASPSPEQITSTSNANGTDRHTPMTFSVLQNLGHRHQIHKQADLVGFMVWRNTHSHTHTHYFTLVWQSHSHTRWLTNFKHRNSILPPTTAMIGYAIALRNCQLTVFFNLCSNNFVTTQTTQVITGHIFLITTWNAYTSTHTHTRMHARTHTHTHTKIIWNKTALFFSRVDAPDMLSSYWMKQFFRKQSKQCLYLFTKKQF